ncbi:hypothetical protein Lalb_Chr08g0232991 [Lupinus albus]|uniref:Transmembrane protein n=1 Tax=Lupinus albus TaxID=3870 RepID=A0A6A4Q3V2_LUPAL|nr:hypothetical protein Lalb_Chr08g0232991 [Lupinus albus]
MYSHSQHSFTSIKLPLPTSFSIPFTPSTTSSSPISSTLTLSFISKPNSLNTSPFNPSLVTSLPPIHSTPQNLGFRPTSEFGILSQFFVLSMAFGAFFAVAVVSVPTIIAFGRLEASMKKLSKVVSEEVPGTLSSFKLSTMELKDLTQQLINLRYKISGSPIVKKDGNTTS